MSAATDDVVRAPRPDRRHRPDRGRRRPPAVAAVSRKATAHPPRPLPQPVSPPFSPFLQI